MMITRNYKFRLYPTIQQQNKLQNNVSVCRWVYNRFVEIAQNNFVSRNDLNYFLTELKQSEPWLYNYHSKMLQMVSTQLEGSQKALIELGKKGYKVGNLKFARYEKYRTFVYNQSGYKLEQHGKTDLLWLSKIGFIEIRKHRELSGKIKQISISRSKSGKWYAIITCNINTVTDIKKIDYEKSIGIDVGIKNFAYDSKGYATPNPLNLKKLLKPLVRIQKKISRRQKGSNNRKKAVKFYQRIHERIANRRRDFHHKLSTQYAKNNDIIFVERLEKLNMVKNHKLARNIMDSGWGIFFRMLEYKCKMIVEVSARNTTIDCSRCGNAVPKNLAMRIHHCNKCGLTLDRDHNASLNILQNGLCIIEIGNKLPQELWKVTPVKISMRSMKQEDATIYT
ncbi:MAG TPA: RNA-guided endonuclease TnpB family protein [Candidatus Nitrosotalea sp.]|nr:RNA-guided endonuclease TnpB family protein [Candidatus Nitrosotalea sp.]